MTGIPQEAIDAAAKALQDVRYGNLEKLGDEYAARQALIAAAPLIVSHRETATAAAIAKAERERIRQLAVEADAKYVFRINFPDNELRPFADLLTEG